MGGFSRGLLEDAAGLPFLVLRMVAVEISGESHRRLMALKRIVDAVLGDTFRDYSEYVEFVLLAGVEKMLVDPLPDDELLRKTIVAMFRENPEFVADFIARTIKSGEAGRKADTGESYTT
ncbi:MAG: hypothetical protein QXN15_05860 [Candidatus Jordarchaeales archaeon]|nr:hypothetical protein [Candidatus Jordarchaeia archaeon]